MAAERIGYPVLVRPSYVLGGRAMRVCYTADDVRSAPVAPNTLVDRFVEDAIEVDVDAVGDGEDAIVAAVMEHVEEAGVHSGDSACVIPPLSIGPELEAEIRRQTELLVRGLGVQGLCNVQFALHEGTIYVLEANPRASRTVPFVCKAMGIDLVDLACRVTTGSRLAEMNVVIPEPRVVAVKEVVLPFARFPGSDPVLGPEMRSTGEVMALAPDFATTYAKAMRAAGLRLPARPNGHRAVAFLSVCDRDKPAATLLAQRLADLGFDLVATPGTARRIKQLGIEVTEVAKVGEADGNSVVDLVRGGKVDLIVNTPVGRGARADGYQIRRAAISAKVPVHHDARRGQRGRAGDRARLAGRAEEPAGAARLTLARVAACEPLGPYVQVRLERTFAAGEPGPVPHAAPARARRAAGAPALGRRLRRRERDVPLPAARRRRSRRSRVVGAEVEVLGPFGRGFDAAAAGRRAAARGRRLRRRAARAALAAAAGRRAAGGVPRRRRRARGRARAGGRARDRARRPPTCSSCWRRAWRGASCVLAAGPDGLVRAVAAACAAAEVPCQVALEAPMACGYGACYGCAVRLGGALVRLCVEGPVVAGARLAAA